jgi:16S rRNA (adenine1518-N6/adenine1519-N6)-dimethyltransferase
MEFENLPSIKQAMETHGLQPSKKFGQNFLLDQNVTDKIARNAGDLTASTVIEVGPGPGGLTRSLLHAGARRVVAVEIDHRCVKILEDLLPFSQERLEVHQQDALKIDWDKFLNEQELPIKIVANLPYNVATPLLILWLKEIEKISSMTLMFQKEVAERITAVPKTKAYGRLSVLTQWLCHTNLLFILPPHIFTPPPKVDSAIVQFVPKKEVFDVQTFDALEKVLQAAFGQRRKMLRSSLKGFFGDKLEEICAAAKVQSTQRAEELTVDQFLVLASFCV